MAGSLSILAAGINNVGRVRKNNEDSLYLNGRFMQPKRMNDGFNDVIRCNDAVQVYAVCDGMGGLDAGEVASYMAVSNLSGIAKAVAQHSKEEVLQEIRRISRLIAQYSREKNVHTGTTLAMVTIENGRATVYNVGDSRVYLLRNQKLTQLSTDHTELQQLLTMGVLNPREAAAYPRKHVITQFVGMSGDAVISPSIYDAFELRQDDVMLLCSDGVTDMLSDNELYEILMRTRNPQEAAQRVVEQALQKGGVDNTTAIVLKADGYNEEIQLPKRLDFAQKLPLLLTILQYASCGCAAIALIDLLLNLFIGGA